MKNKDILYGIKTAGSRVYISTDKENEHYIGVKTFEEALLFEDEKYAKVICNHLNNGQSKLKFETFKVLNPFKNRM
jgi:hypothetical protein